MKRYLVFMLAASLVVVACNGGSSTDPCEGITCSGHGTCAVSNVEAICDCDEGYGGDLCAECGEGYHEEASSCVVNEVCEADSCSGHGVCFHSEGLIVCDCDEGYTGERCDECGEGHHEEAGSCVVNEVCELYTCFGHGTCDDSTGVVTCACDEGYDGFRCETCSSGYQDNDGDGACLPDCATSGLSCGLHGACDDSSGTAVCVCDDGWDGPDCSVELFGIEWVVIPGGTFMMGSDTGNANEQPVHEVTVSSFEMTISEVTVGQFQACVDAGVCGEPGTGSSCNWGVAGRENQPVNCVNWQKAVDFCEFAGGRLPSESEWEYAARSGSQDIAYPWGDQIPTCEYAVMNEIGVGDGCGMDRTWAVCSKPAGNTAQGLCDMSGNVWEMVQDWYHEDYNGAPADGSAWEIPSGSDRVIRGGSFINGYDCMHVSFRIPSNPSSFSDSRGFRCNRDLL